MRERLDGNRRERVRFVAGHDHRHTRVRVREDERRRPRPGDGNVHARAARRRVAPHVVGNCARRPEQPLEAADVHRHEIGAVPLVARGVLAGYRVYGNRGGRGGRGGR